MASAFTQLAARWQDLVRGPSPNYNPSIVALRAIAVSTVFIFHIGLGLHADDLLVGGYVGVDLFFVISGFLITESLVADMGRRGAAAVPRFYLRRAIRLLPPLLVIIAVFILAALAAGLDGATIFRESAAGLLHISDWTRALGYGFPDYLGHLWSLAVEEQFYLLWPTLLLLAGARPRLALGLIAAVVLWRAVLFHLGHANQFRIYNGLDTRADGLLIGAFLGLIGRTRLSRLNQTAVRAAEIAAAIYLVWYVCNVRFTEDWIYDYGFVASWLAGAALVVASLTPGNLLLSRLARLPAVLALGNLSYSIYLWHYPAITILSRHFALSAPAFIGAVAIITLAGASATYLLVELPALKYLRTRFSARFKAAEADPQAAAE